MIRNLLFALMLTALSSNLASLEANQTLDSKGRLTSSGPTCRVIIETPIYLEVAISDGICGTDQLLSGRQTVSGKAQNTGRDITVVIQSTFVGGKPTANTIFNTSIGMSFEGKMFLDARSLGRGVSPSGFIFEGEMRGKTLWAGKLTSPAATGSLVSYYLQNKVVGVNQYQEYTNAKAAAEALPVDVKPTVQLGTLTPVNTYTICQSPTFQTGKDKITRTLCRGKLASGMLTVRVPRTDGHQLEYQGQYKLGLVVGNVRLNDLTNGSIFIGTLRELNPDAGTTTRPDGSTEYGTFRATKLYTGSLQKPGPHGRTLTLTFENGQLVGPSEQQQIAAIIEEHRPKHIVRMTRVQLDSGKCQADLPRGIFKIQEAIMEERCKSGLYSGPAKLTLKPLTVSGRAQTIETNYVDGLVVGQSKVVYGAGGGTFTGTLANWAPDYGELAEPTGNDNYAVTTFTAGKISNQYSEYRQPSQGEIFGRQLLGTIVRAGAEAIVSCTVGQCAEDRKARRSYEQGQREQAMRDAEAYQKQQAQNQENQRQADITRQQTLETNARLQREASEARQRELDQIEDARRRQLAGLDRDGNPIQLPTPPVQIARADPPPVLVAETNQSEEQVRPVLDTRGQEFGGHTEPQGNPPTVTTNAPELPGPVPGAPPILEPVRGIEPPAPPEPVRVAEIPEPIRPEVVETGPQNPVNQGPPLAGPVYPQPVDPVQPSNQNDTLETGPAPSNPVPQPQPQYEPARPSQPAVDAANRPTATPASVARNILPAVPSNLQTDTSVSPRVRILWNLVEGATYYEVGLRELSTNKLILNAQAPGGGIKTSALPVGNYRWNVAACNSNGCSQYTNAIQFSIVGTTASSSVGFGFSSDDARWIQSLPAELQVQVLRLTGAQVQAYKDRGDWLRFKQIVTQAAGEMRNIEIEEQREKLAIWESAWSQSQRVLIEGSLWLIPVEKFAVAAYNMSKVVRGARIAQQNQVLIGGATCVYTCIVNGVTRYVGITDDIARRGGQHLREKGIIISEIRGLSNLSRTDARSVEQTLIHYYGFERNGGTLLNQINSISSVRNQSDYEAALIRGKRILDSVGYQWTN